MSLARKQLPSDPAAPSSPAMRSGPVVSPSPAMSPGRAAPSDLAAQPSPAVSLGQAGVVVVHRTGVGRRFFCGALAADPGLAVVGEATNGEEALALVERLRPAAVLMPLDLPRPGSIDAIEKIMAVAPTAIVVSSSAGDVEQATAALAAGAVEVVAQPQSRDVSGLSGYAENLRRGVRIASRVKVITHPRARLRTGILAPGRGRRASRRAAGPPPGQPSRPGSPW